MWAFDWLNMGGIGRWLDGGTIPDRCAVRWGQQQDLE